MNPPYYDLEDTSDQALLLEKHGPGCPQCEKARKSAEDTLPQAN
jgi:hypothetical protein